MTRQACISLLFCTCIYRECQKCIRILTDVIYELLFEVELNYGSNVQQDVRSKDGVNKMNASVTMRQEVGAKKCIHIIRKEKVSKMYTHFKKRNICIKIEILNSSNNNRVFAIFFDCSACCMMTLAFISLTPSFERTSYYTLRP
jgi:hypothetical protein